MYICTILKTVSEKSDNWTVSTSIDVVSDVITTFHWNFFSRIRWKKECTLEKTNCAKLYRGIYSEGEKKRRRRSVRKFRENRKVPRVLGGWANNFVGYKSNAISLSRAEYGARVSIMEKARRREVTKNLVPSETNHLGTFCDGTHGSRDSFFAAIYIFQYIRGITQSSKVGWQCHWKRNSMYVSPTRFMYQ